MNMAGIEKQGTPDHKFQYNGKEKQEEIGFIDYGAGHYDATLGRFFTQDRFAEKYYNLNPYQYVANNPINGIDVNGDSIIVTQLDGNINIHFTGMLINNTHKDYSLFEMMNIALEMSSSIEQTFGGEKGDLSVTVTSDIEVGTEKDLKEGQHAIYLTESMTIPGAEEREGIMGRAGFGQNYIYINSDLIGTKVTEGAMSWTGKTTNKKGTLFRTFSHEFGHSAGLEGHPLEIDAPGNLML
ncbi:RHS repeat-associated core domain-containing protein [Flammeovirga pectinis]|uniref:RHS repeat-associated core domain-containing protein n=1 Tax=Flammeovirga pectinis TaxID=2494373 RepID=A0A3S9P9C4_9BACT|nr:RHS repeat-associated core domain-containing protein [Flammeovirga pectinis]AZQ64815.1 RHS repeat-associated core domain-containing protein [Flammeovirga pectinis]